MSIFSGYYCSQIFYQFPEEREREREAERGEREETLHRDNVFFRRNQRSWMLSRGSSRCIADKSRASYIAFARFGPQIAAALPIIPLSRLENRERRISNRSAIFPRKDVERRYGAPRDGLVAGNRSLRNANDGTRLA